MIGNFPSVLNFNRLFLKLNRFICNLLPFPLKQHLANNNNVVGGFDVVFPGLPIQNCTYSCIYVPPTTIENTEIRNRNIYQRTNPV